MKHYLGIDLGGTKIAAAVADKNLSIKEELKTPTPKNKKDIFNSLVEIIEYFSQKYPIKNIGIGAPGMINNQGKVVNAPNLRGWNGFPLKKNLSHKFKNLTFYVENDANCAAIAEQLQGAGKEYNNFVYITISTGIGGGIIINKNIYRGADGTAGEIGHMIISKNSTKCNCGYKGCWEGLCSGTAIAKKASLNKEIKKLAKGSVINTELLCKLANKGHKEALSLFEDTGQNNAIALSNIKEAINPQAFIIGGGVTKCGKHFWNPLKKALKKYRFQTPIIKAKGNSGTVGAIALAIKGN